MHALHAGPGLGADSIAHSVVDRVGVLEEPSRATLRHRFFEDLTRFTLGLIRVRHGGQFLGPLELIRLGEPSWQPAGDGSSGGRWVHPILGGVLTRRAAGTLSIGWEDGEASVEVAGYEPSLPAAVYDFTQRPFHRFVARLSLLDLRGRRPPPGYPSDPLTRAAAGAIDIAACLLLARAFRRSPLAVAIPYHLAGWIVAGTTPGGVFTGQRIVSVDGSRLTPGQAALRLALLPLALFRRRAVHDAIAGTEVVRT